MVFRISHPHIADEGDEMEDSPAPRNIEKADIAIGADPSPPEEKSPPKPVRRPPPPLPENKEPDRELDIDEIAEIPISPGSALEEKKVEDQKAKAEMEAEAENEDNVNEIAQNTGNEYFC